MAAKKSTKGTKEDKRQKGRKRVQSTEDNQWRNPMPSPLWNDIFELCDIVRETGYAIHEYLRNGHVEKVYENALVHRLRKQGLKVLPQHPLEVRDVDGTILGEFFADLFIEDVLLVELKAVRHVVDEHVAQLLGYMRCAQIGRAHV